MNSGAGASLRWRSRISKEAVNQDDSRFDAEKGKAGGGVTEDYGLGGKERALRLPMRQLWLSRLGTLLAMSASGSALCVLVVDKYWYSAITSTLTIFLSLLFVYASRRLRRLGSVRLQVNYGRQRYNALRTQNERLYRQLQHLDGLQSRLERIQHEMTKLIGDPKDTARMVQAVERWRVLQQQIHEVLRHDVQQEILQAVLLTDRDASFELSAPELERLIVRLKALPGIQLNEAAFRRQLEMEGERSLHAILRLIRRIIDDTQITSSSSSAILQLDARGYCQASSAQSRQQGQADLLGLDQV
jgi:hypothetical protein